MKRPRSLTPVPRVPLLPGDEYHVFSVRQPWAWALIHAGKDVENRPRRTHYRGPLLIHASGGRPRAEEVAALRALVRSLDKNLELPATYATGELVGLVDLVDCREDSRSVWAQDGAMHLMLRNARAVQPGIKLRGQLGIWRWTVGTVSHGWTRRSDRG